jgi:peptidoglycan-N-acetylglucosamine deacetylase
VWSGIEGAALMLTFDVDAESAVLAEGRHFGEHLMLMSHQAFGPLVAVPRILGLLKDMDLSATFFVPGWTADHYPGIIESIIEAGHEIGHHSYSHRIPGQLTDNEERADFERALESLARIGATPIGYRAPSSSPSPRMPELLLEFGLSYDSSLMDDDRPYRLETDRGEIIEFPVNWILDDWLQYCRLPIPSAKNRTKPPDLVFEGWRSELDAAREYGCLFPLTLHPFCSGRGGRFFALRRLLEYAVECNDVRCLNGQQLYERVRHDPALQRRRFSDLDPEPDTATYPRFG